MRTWLRQHQACRAVPARWSRDDIVEGAGLTVTTDCVDPLTMRPVAREFGCSPMALYRHVRRKDELFRQPRPGQRGGDVVDQKSQDRQAVGRPAPA
ncbi:TetR/AcrR family transcriptional regulator [Amycolatopsis sp. NPDC023774]|uniref:TetR/AcrR family transcriptional regulator n=1 Tax=Amycolatopsis sp. NPDC023774 TaxID=3155015 RepID=UPI0033F9A6F9